MANDHDKFTCGCDSCNDDYREYWMNHAPGKNSHNEDDYVLSDSGLVKFGAGLVKAIEENTKKEAEALASIEIKNDLAASHGLKVYRGEKQ